MVCDREGGREGGSGDRMIMMQSLAQLGESSAAH